MPYALMSVSDKTGIVAFAQQIAALGFTIISTGGTKQTLDQAGVETIAIDDVTGFPEMMDGRVKTLHPKIHGGLLARRDLPTHLNAAKSHGIELIDLVVVNLYPFKQTILKEAVAREEAIENIDIGGPSMLRSAAKNHASVTVIVDPSDYEAVLNELQNGQTTLETRQRLAAKVFRHTAGYDALIADYLTKEVKETLPESLTLTYELKQSLRYGENAQQEAVFYQSALPEMFSIAQATQRHGKELSYNNIKDADAALRIAREFNEPAAVALKHMNPCGVGLGQTIEEAFERCYQADPISIFGGVIVLNRPVNLKTAQALHEIFLEIVIAPGYNDDAFALLSQKKNIRLLELDFSDTQTAEKEVVSVLGGILVQDQDWQTDKPEWTVVTEKEPTVEQLDHMDFAFKVVKHVKSNAIVVALDNQTIGIGAGQMNRVGAARIALEQAKETGHDLTQAVLASDAFFPMRDTLDLAAEYGIKLVIQPGGSIKDADSIAAANEHGMVMVQTGLRHFRH